MSDSIGTDVKEGLKDLFKGIFAHILQTPKTVVKEATQQVTGVEDSEEKKQSNELQANARVQELEAEMRRISEEKKQMTGPEIGSKEQIETNDDLKGNKVEAPDEASRQAVGKAEQGRNFKG